jgi:hypothetical protein
MAYQRAHRRAVLPMGDMFAVGGCDCNCNATSNPITCKGCNSLVLVSVAIQVWDHSGGTLLSTLTTNSSGIINVASGTYWMIPADGRFVGQNVTVSTSGSVTFSAASGYVCISSCAIPVASVLHFTDSVYGTCTLTYSPTGASWDASAGWVGSFSASGAPAAPCGTACPGGGFTYYVNWRGIGAIDTGWTTATGHGVCPGSGPGLSGVFDIGSASITCPPSFAVNLSQTTPTCAGLNQNVEVYGPSVSYTQTITE